MSKPSVCVEEALDRIRPGSHVLLHSACAEPQTLVEGLVAGIRAGRPNLRDLTLVSLTYRSGGAAAPPYADVSLLKDGLLHNLFSSNAWNTFRAGEERRRRRRLRRCRRRIRVFQIDGLVG